MKIALLRQRVTALGGAETTLSYLVRGMTAAGHEVAVYGSRTGGHGPGGAGAGRGLRAGAGLGGEDPAALEFCPNSRRLLQDSGPQIVFSLERILSPQVYRAGDGCHREFLSRRAPYLPPLARAAQWLTPFHRVMLGVEQRLFTSPELRRVIANSRQVRDEIIRLYGVDPARLRVIVNGLDRQRFHPLDAGAAAALRQRLGAPENGAVVLFAGSGFERKGLTYLLQAFGSLRDKACHLWVVGKGHIPVYRRAAERLGVADRVRFWGPVTETAPFYQAAAVLALPTIYDPCSNVVLEALGCGTPAITTVANGAAEFITPGANGAVIPQPDDIAGLAAALAVFLTRGRDPQVRQAAAQAVAELSWEKTVAQTLEVLKEAGP